MSRYCTTFIRKLSTAQPKLSVKNVDVRTKRKALFEKEVERLKSLVPRIEKIEVRYVGQRGDSTMIMNKNISTPYNCAMHLDELLMKRSVLALVNGQPWDIHRPLEDNCELRLLHFREDDPTLVNKVFWRSCSFLLGLVAEKAFKDDYFVELHSWPSVNIRSGSFVYDVDLKLENWSPREDELRTLTTIMRQITSQNLLFERLSVDKSLALKMFEDNSYKCEQIPKICEKMDSETLTLYKVGDHIDISQGPMIANTNLIGACAIASVHKVQEESKTHLHRFQGVALPASLPLNHFMFDFLKKRAHNYNDFKYIPFDSSTKDTPTTSPNSAEQTE